ncbi:Sedlin, region [Ostertagia ostertagi]
MRHPEDSTIDIFNTAIDIVDEKAVKANEMFLGHLYTDQKYKAYFGGCGFQSFGFITNTGVRMILVLEANNLEWKDFDIRSLFKRFHNLYCMQISICPTRDEIRSKSLLEAAAQMISAHVEG